MVQFNHDAEKLSDAIGVNSEDMIDLAEGIINTFSKNTPSIQEFSNWLSDDNLLAKIGAIAKLISATKKIFATKVDKNNDLTVADLTVSSYLMCIDDLFEKPSVLVEYLYNNFPSTVPFLYKIAMLCSMYIIGNVAFEEVEQQQMQ